MQWLVIILLPTADCRLPTSGGPSPLSDRERFPSQQVACEALRFNRAYRAHVEARQAVERRRWWEWQEVIGETDALYQCWDWLHAAQEGEGRDEAYWRQALERLRELLGDEAYAAGRMPPPVPLWRFTLVD